MFKGFYNLTSGMLSQERRLDIVANNMTNTATAGYKTDRYTDSTFEEYLVSRIDQGRTSTQLGGESYILAPSQVYTDFTQGAFETTGLPLDFAIQGDGFFAVETADGVAYTRAGNFCLDDEGYLCLAEQGRVLNPAGEPLLLITDDRSAYSSLRTTPSWSGTTRGCLSTAASPPARWAPWYRSPWSVPMWIWYSRWSA